MPTLEETLSNITNEVSQISADISDIGVATPTKAGLVAISNDAIPDDNSVPTVAFFKSRNILGSGGEAGGGLPQTELDKVNALPPQEVLAALSSLPASLTGLAGQIIAVNSTGDGYEVVVAPVGGGGGIPTNIVVDHFTGDGSTTAFTLSRSPANSNALDISVGGMSIDPAIYNVSGTTLTFNDAPPITDTDAIVVRHLGTVAAIADGSIITIKIANGAITLPKMANGTPGKYLKYNDSTGVLEEVDAVVGAVGDNTITTQKIVNKNVTLAKIADGTPGKIIGFNSSTGVAEEQSIIVPDNSIVTNKISNKAVTLAKMADGTPGKFLKFNDSTGVIEEANGTAGATGVWNLIEEQIVTSNVSQVAFTTNIDSTYKEYRMRSHGVERAGGSGSNIQLQITKNGGVSYESTNEYHYSYDQLLANSPGSPQYAASLSATFIDLGHHEDGATGVIEITFYEPASNTLEKVFRHNLISARSPDTIWSEGVGMYGRTDFSPINGFRLFFANADSFSAGRFVLEGRN